MDAAMTYRTFVLLFLVLSAACTKKVVLVEEPAEGAPETVPTVQMKGDAYASVRTSDGVLVKELSLDFTGPKPL